MQNKYSMTMAWLIGLALVSFQAHAQDTKRRISEGHRVGIEYTLKTDDGKVADTNVDKVPLIFMQGEGRIFPALEEAIEGLAVNETKTVTLTPKQGYGEVNPEGFRKIPLDQIPEEAREPGTILLASGPNGEQRRIRVVKITESDAHVDFNHPLAGRSIIFEVKIISIE